MIPICIWGDRGIGKTALIHEYCLKHKIGFRVFHPAHNTNGADIVGLPYFDRRIERTVHARPLWLPSSSDGINFSDQGLIFIDEINRAPSAVLQGLTEPLGEGTLEQAQWKLPPNWGFICAADPPRPGYEVAELDEALMNRMLHIPLSFDVVSWVAWAETEEVPDDVRTFTAKFPEMMAKTMTALPKEIEINATPRSMEYLARLYEPGMNPTLLTIIAEGLIGDLAAKAFLEHVQPGEQSLVTALEILGGDFEEKLGAQISADNNDLIRASQTMLVAKLANTKYNSQEDDAVVQQIVRYMNLLGSERAQSFWAELSTKSRDWAVAVHAIQT